MGLDTRSNQNVLHTLASLHIRTFPIRHNSKLPYRGESWLDHVAVRHDHDWSEHNLAVATGHGLVVIDFDNKADTSRNGMGTLAAWDMLDKLPTSFRVRTPSGGVHVYLSLPEGVKVANSQSRLAPGVDVRGENGYVVAPGSTIEGHGYEVIAWGPIEPCPDWLLEQLPPPPERITLAFDVEMDTDANTARAVAYLERHAPEAIEGHGGDLTTFKVAARVKDFGVSEGMCHALMLDHWNDTKASPPWSFDGLAAKVASAYRNGSLPPGVATPEADAERLPPEDVERILSRSQTLAERAAANPARESDSGGLPDLGTATTAPAKGATNPGGCMTPWTPRDPATIARPRFLYGDFYARGYTSLTIAEPKVGKSMFSLAECVDMVSGQGFLLGGHGAREPLKVGYYNAEDDHEVLAARVVAACHKYGVPQDALSGNLVLGSGVGEGGFVLVADVRGQPAIVDVDFGRLEQVVRENRLDVIVLDPLQDLSHSEESNQVFRLLGQRLRAFAHATGVSIGLVHHTRKVAVGLSATIDDARGGSALRGTARFNRVLVAMTEDEGAEARVHTHKAFFRIGDVESNLAPPSAAINRWFQKVSVEIAQGHGVGVVAPWAWPDVAEGVSDSDVAAVVALLGRAVGSADGPYRESPRAVSRWAGEAVAEALGLVLDDKNDRKRARDLLVKWLNDGVLKVVEHKDSRQGRPVKCLVPNDDEAGDLIE